MSLTTLQKQLCRKCKTRPVTLGAYAPDFCDDCIGMCHEALEFDHLCMICASPEEAREHGWEPWS
jgi:hypothetical protein